MAVSSASSSIVPKESDPDYLSSLLMGYLEEAKRLIANLHKQVSDKETAEEKAKRERRRDRLALLLNRCVSHISRLLAEKHGQPVSAITFDQIRDLVQQAWGLTRHISAVIPLDQRHHVPLGVSPGTSSGELGSFLCDRHLSHRDNSPKWTNPPANCPSCGGKSFHFCPTGGM